jgi:hypothetical protein
MLRFPDIQRSRRRKGLFALSSLLLLVSSQGLAQSGRKTTKPPQDQVSIPQPSDDTPESKLGTRDLQNKVTLLVGRQGTSKKLLSEDSIFATFVKRLNEIKGVSATSLGDLKRDDLVKRAKTETAAIVIMVRFDVDSFQNGTIILNSPDLDVEIAVFTPVTGQEKFKGKVYYKAVGGPMMKKDNWPNGTPIRITTEAVGIEAAEQVGDWLLVEDLKKRSKQ